MNEFNSQVCTSIEQSQRLLELGLNPETADMSHQYLEAEWDWFIFPCDWNRCAISEELIPAWSLHRLLCLYGQDYIIKELYNNAEECYGMLISAIEIAIENDEFNKEYLKQ